MKILLRILFLMVLPLQMFAGKVTISTDVPGNRAEVGETFHIRIDAEDCAGKINISQMPPGVKVVYHTSQSSTRQFTQNGTTIQSGTTSLIMTCKGETIGSYTFGPVSVDGVRSNTLSYKIVASTGKSGSSSQNSSSSSNSQSSMLNFDPNAGPLFIGKGNEEMFLRANVNKTTAYEQEAIEYTVKLYTTYGDIKFLGATAAPKFDGFVVEESDQISTSFVFEDYNGKSYKTAVIARYIIFPQKAGKLKVTGNTYTVSTDARQYYHDPYFQTMTVKYPVQLNVTPNEVDINVKELPTPVPANYIGGVGTFRVTSSMPTTSLKTNSPATLIYTFEGTGNVKYIKMPDLANIFPSAIEVYTPESKVDVKAGTSNVSGKTTFEYSLLPRESGDYTIPSLTLYYFDPQDGQYKELTTQSYKVSVARGEASDKSQQARTFDSELMKEQKLSLNAGKPWIESPLFWLWFIIPFLAFIGGLIADRKRTKARSDMVALRSRKANKIAMKRLARAYQCYKRNKEEEFFDEMLAALWGYVADKLKMPTSDLNKDNVKEEFARHSVSEETFAPILRLINECEFAKFAPAAAKVDMLSIYNDALSSIEKIESEYNVTATEKDREMEEGDDKDSESYTNSMSLDGRETKTDNETNDQQP